MNDCCEWFFWSNCLQNILNIPLQCCGYCGRKLTSKEFKKINGTVSMTYQDKKWLKENFIDDGCGKL